MRVVHAVVTSAFAGTERYVADVANAQADAGMEVSVVGGLPLAEELRSDVRWLPGDTLAMALRSAAHVGRVDVAHAHLTYGEFVLAATQRVHRGRLLATRHLATPRGRSRAGAVIRPFVERRLAGEIAISRFVGDAIGVTRVVHNGVVRRERANPEESTTVVIAQRLEREKATGIGLDAWFRSSLPRAGWSLSIAGAGSERAALEAAAAEHPLGGTVRLLGHVRDMEALYASAAAVLAPAPAEPLGLTVLEAMSRGVPAIAAAGGGHLESLAKVPQLLFPAGDASAAASVLDRLLLPGAVGAWSTLVQRVQREDFDLDGHLRRLTEVYVA